MKRKFIKFIALTIILTLISLLYPSVSVVDAAPLTSMSDTLSTLTASTAANHTFQFTLAAGNTFATTETIVITFPAGFDLSSLANSDALDYDIKTDTGGTPVDETIVVSGNCASSDAIEITSITGQVITFTACGNYTATPTAAGIEIEIGTNATLGGTGDTQITNPTAGSQTISLAAGGDTGDIVVVIIADDQVAVSASVSASLSFSISDTTIGFGTITTGTIRYATGTTGSDTEPGTDLPVNLVASTNSTSGLTVTVRSANAGLSGPATIAAVASTAVTTTTEGYGVYGKGAASLTIDEGFDNDGTSDLAVTTSAQTFVSTTGTVDNGDVDLAIKAGISGTTAAGSYTDTLTLICTGNF